MRPSIHGLLATLLLALSGCFGAGPQIEAGPPAGETSPPPPPLVVVAHIDTGINPYHVIFRDASPLAYQHPSTYLPGYPADAPALNLTLDGLSYADALKMDAPAWTRLELNTLYWVPGTRIVGLIARCDPPVLPAPVQDECPTRLGPDPHGHGTMTASRSVGPHSLAPTARFVSIQGLGAAGVRWAADQGWIDVQTNSWLSFVPPQASRNLPPEWDGTTEAFEYAAKRMVTLAASGNGAGYINGFAPTPTYALSTAAPGVILVGAHDNGYVTLWHGQPTHVVADGYGGPRADRDSTTGYGPNGDSCCTSASSPYAAGGAAAIILEARSILNDATPGIVDGVLAEAGNGTTLPPKGPLSDGKFTLEEFRRAYFGTAQARPVEGPHDGLLHWAASGGVPNPSDPGGNPYCPGCWTTPVPWSGVPAAVPAHPVVGYGAIDAASVAFARDVLAGAKDLPDRGDVDAYWGLDQTLREGLVVASAALVSPLASP